MMTIKIATVKYKIYGKNKHRKNAAFKNTNNNSNTKPVQ